MGTSRVVLDRVGPLDEDPRLRPAEDCDLSCRAYARSYGGFYVKYRRHDDFLVALRAVRHFPGPCVDGLEESLRGTESGSSAGAPI